MMNKLLAYLQSVLDLLVPKNGGGAVGNVYGKRASELSLCDFSQTPITFFTTSNDSTGEDFSYVTPSDGYVIAYAQRAESFLGLKNNGMKVEGWLTLTRTSQNNVACFIPVKKGQEISLHYTNSGGMVFGYFFTI